MTLLQKAWLRLRIKWLYKFFCTSNEEKWLLVKALYLVCGTTLALWILPFWITRRLTSRVPANEIGILFSVNQIVWAVETTSRYIPGAACLSKAMAAQVLLAEYGHRSELRIGVARDNGRLRAHAWLEDDGEILIGGNLDNYKPLHMKEISLSNENDCPQI